MLKLTGWGSFLTLKNGRSWFAEYPPNRKKAYIIGRNRLKIVVINSLK